jgi:hypothetical protein
LTLTRGDRIRILCGRPPRGFRTARFFTHPSASAVRKRTIGGTVWSKP